jgi:hypothetical protein
MVIQLGLASGPQRLGLAPPQSERPQRAPITILTAIPITLHRRQPPVATTPIRLVTEAQRSRRQGKALIKAVVDRVISKELPDTAALTAHM